MLLIKTKIMLLIMPASAMRASLTSFWNLSVSFWNLSAFSKPFATSSLRIATSSWSIFISLRVRAWCLAENISENCSASIVRTDIIVVRNTTTKLIAYGVAQEIAIHPVHYDRAVLANVVLPPLDHSLKKSWPYSMYFFSLLYYSSKYGWR